MSKTGGDESMMIFSFFLRDPNRYLNMLIRMSLKQAQDSLPQLHINIHDECGRINKIMNIH